MSVVSSAKSAVVRAARKVVSLLRREPVAAWGLLATLVLNVVSQVAGLSGGVVEAVSSVLLLVGVPVVRSRVRPLDVVKAFVEGAEAPKQ